MMNLIAILNSISLQYLFIQNEWILFGVTKLQILTGPLNK